MGASGNKEENKVQIQIIKCTYDIKNYNYTQIINNTNGKYINNEIESKIKILNNGAIEELVFQKKFSQLGINEIDFIVVKALKNMSYLFNQCSSLKEIKFINMDTALVGNMNSMFSGCAELEYIDISIFRAIFAMI